MLAIRPAIIATTAALAALASTAAVAQEEPVAPGCVDVKKAGDIARSLANPIGTQAAVPVVSDTELGVASNQDARYLLAVAAGIPIIINKDWHIATKASIGMVDQAAPSGTSPINLTDTSLTAMLVPPTVGPLMFGLGATSLFPTATSSTAGAGMWGVGPAAGAVLQVGGFTLGALAAHTFGFAPHEGRESFQVTEVNPFVSYSTESGLSIEAQSDTAFRWHHDSTGVTLPVELGLSQVAVEAPIPISFQASVAYFIVRPVEDARWRVRFAAVFALPSL